MPRFIFSREARNDLINIRRYIREELENPSAAVRIISRLKESMERLKDFPGAGKPLDALIPVHTEYRYMVCENYCIFYLTNERETMIIRILHQRQDCLRALF
jgi:toxin ParE1/3/4